MNKPTSKFLWQRSSVWAAAAILGAAPLLQWTPAALADAANGSAQKPAVQVADAVHAPILAATHAGPRIVAVGDHGVVLLSDDEGKTFRQARSVPSQTLLTSVCFIDEKQGWIAGHDSVVLHTEDGGETWALQHEDLNGDKPLFSIWFKDAQHGIAAGLFGTAVQTADGGRSWVPLAVESGAETDHHLNSIFGDGAPMLYIAGEA
ncbi:MAG: WD40/YVTN/BNR-like repeat-containing protein, partial [Stenotrophobium sp.]